MPQETEPKLEQNKQIETEVELSAEQIELLIRDLISDDRPAIDRLETFAK
jgi:hypothetical protein